ncbi:flavocytochrome c [uncultured Limosilactobacillus sp.]|uniref:flavocytochrome c n=1 Tax=uncultured Limosilactobacillus sp. TaxID=2837629 RepID=UPI0025D13A32|nr:flavocytochrome c [uncultured Limosilactobacillus sp.]
MTTVDYDLIVIGAGGAGLTAAVQAHELGLTVAVLEKNAKVGGNTSRASSGMNAAETSVQARHHIADRMQDFYDETYQGGGKLNDPAMLRQFVTHAPLAVEWLVQHGLPLDDLTITGGMTVRRTHRPASTAPVGAYLVKGLQRLANDAGIHIITNAKVRRLLMSAGRVSGVQYTADDNHDHQLSSSAVVLTTGGFGASQKLIQRYRPDLANYRTTNQPGATGDGLVLARQVGAQLMQLDLVQVHPTVQQDQEHAFLIGEAVRGEGAILVNAQGQRFVDELATRRVVSNAITALPDHHAYLIFDQQVRQRVQAIDFYDQIGLVKVGKTLDDLAGQLQLTDLQTTINEWNQAVNQHSDQQFGRHTGMGTPLMQAPFYAIHVAPAIHYTMGGIHVDPMTRVLNANGQVIDGLYAAGEVTGGLHGNNRIGGNSIAETVVFGRQAAMTIQRDLNK